MSDHYPAKSLVAHIGDFAQPMMAGAHVLTTLYRCVMDTLG